MAAAKKKKIVKWIIVAIVLILIVVFVSQCGKGVKQIKTVDVTEVKKGDVTSTMDTSGMVASENSKSYVSPVTATIAEVNVKVGQAVKAGDYLVTYDTASLESTYTQAQLQAKSSSATNADTLAKSNQNAQEVAKQSDAISELNNQITAAQSDAANAKAAVAQNQADSGNVSAQLSAYKDKIATADTKTSKEDLASWKKAAEALTNQASVLNTQAAALTSDMEAKTGKLTSLQTDLAAAQSKKDAAEASIMSDNAKASLNYTSQATELTVTNAQTNLTKAKAGVVADFDGIVTAVPAVSGGATAEGQPLVTVANTGAMKVDIQVSKYNLPDLSVGQKATITVLKNTYNGTISSISKMASADMSGASTGAAASASASTAGGAATGAKVAAEVHIDNPDTKLILGMDAKLSIALGNVKDALVVPVAAVNNDKDGDFVYVVKNKVVKKQAITTGLYGKEQVEITKGLEKGDHVVTAVDSSIEEGMTIVENLVKD
jgi:RND family efflux transporter MFP subunit